MDALAGEGHEVAEIPSTGLGGSEGPGTYSYHKEFGVEMKLRLDPRQALPQKGEHSMGEQNRGSSPQLRTNTDCTVWSRSAHVDESAVAEGEAFSESAVAEGVVLTQPRARASVPT